MSQDCYVDNSGIFGSKRFFEQVTQGITKFRIESPEGSLPRVWIYRTGNKVRIAQQRFPDLIRIVELDWSLFEQHITSLTSFFTMKDKVDYILNNARSYSLQPDTIVPKDLEKALGWNGECS